MMILNPCSRRANRPTPVKGCVAGPDVRVLSAELVHTDVSQEYMRWQLPCINTYE